MPRTTIRDSIEAPQDRWVHALRVLFAPDPRRRGKTTLVQHAISIGREGGTGDLVVEDPLLSRRHARIDLTSDGASALLSDAGSRNGTFRNGERLGVDAVALGSGDVIRAGGTVIHYERFGQSPAAAIEKSERIVGTSRAMRAVLEQVAIAARGALPVLVIGETGTGKELVASEIHERSARPGRLVPVNCAAIPRDLFESAFFGHKKGSFSGATDEQKGLFQAADQGTLFLDEVGEMPLDAQPKLLRAIETMEVTRVGETRASKVDTRVVAATNRRLDDEVAAGRFRADLVARLRGITILVPPLRERRDDILALFEYFLRAAGGTVVPTADFVERLLLHPWPENVREVEHAVSRLVLESRGEKELRAADAERLLAASAPTLRTPSDLLLASRDVVAGAAHPVMPSREAIEAAFAEAKGKVVDVAARFHTNRQQIYRWLQYHRIDIAVLRARKPEEKG